MNPALLFALAVGLTPSGTVIEAVSVAGSSASQPTILLIGGLDGSHDSAGVVSREVKQYEELPAAQRRFRLVAIPMANPEKASLVFPPEGAAYRDHTESHYLWRWIGTHAPDLVLVAGPDAGLAGALSTSAVAGIGRIPAKPFASLRDLPPAVPESEAHAEIRRRLARMPRQVAEQLAEFYGHELAEVVYIPAVAMIGRVRLGNTADVERIAAPYVDGSRDSLAKPTSSHLAGHLLFAELADRTGKPAYTALTRKAADLAFTPSGEMKDAMPMHNEMSDAVFMGCPILARAGKLTGETRYYDMALRHFRFMRALCLRPDGIYRHSPLDDAAWGRGNAFPALGAALTLSALPTSHPAFAEILAEFRRHAAALARYQNEDGMWREVVDSRGAWPEFSATAMIATAMLRGVRNGWLEAKEYQPRIEAAWRAVSARTAPDGHLIDVCESTGKQKSVTDYLKRTAILDRDPRGGAMALLFATEMAGLP
jgi:rhamnogalacturonyl hydrolase YesR